MNQTREIKEEIASLQNPKVKNTLLLQKARERKKQNLFIVEGKKEVYRALQGGYSFKKIFICREIFNEDGRDSLDDGHGIKGLKTNSIEDLNTQGIEDLNARSSNKGGADRQDKSNEADAGNFRKRATDVGELLSKLIPLLNKLTSEVEINYVTSKVYAHMTYRKESEGIIGWAVPHSHELEKVRLSGNPLLLVIDAVEKPGNLGAILRTVDASGIDALIISDLRTDIYNPNVIRSSLGALFTTQVGIGAVEEVIEWLIEHKLHLYCTALSASIPYTDVDFRQPSAIVMGTEAIGLSETWLLRSDQNIIIPMQGVVDSMNVSVSAGIVLFEALRQRNIK